MTDPRKAALLAAMYDTDDDEAPSVAPVEPAAAARTRKIRVGIVEYEVPTVEYVTRLEQMLAQQQATIERQHRTLVRMQVAMAILRRAVRGQSTAMREVYNELDTKLSIHT